MSSNDKKSKINISSIITAIFLIPLLEKVLTPIYDIVINQIFSTSSIGIHFISSLFYSRISEGVYINIPFYIFIVIISFFLIKIILPLIDSVACNIENIASCEKEHSCNFSQRMKCLFLYSIKQKPVKVFICITLYVLFIFFILTTNFINKNITRTMNNIEIVAPYISDQEYKSLKSDFHAMNSRADFNELDESLKKYATEAELTLK